VAIAVLTVMMLGAVVAQIVIRAEVHPMSLTTRRYRCRYCGRRFNAWLPWPRR